MIKTKINAVLLNKMIVKIQYDLNWYNIPTLFKKICIKAYKKDHEFYSNDNFLTSHKQMFHIDNHPFYLALLKVADEMRMNKRKWYNFHRNYLYWELIQDISSKFSTMEAKARK